MKMMGSAYKQEEDGWDLVVGRKGQGGGYEHENRGEEEQEQGDKDCDWEEYVRSFEAKNCMIV